MDFLKAWFHIFVLKVIKNVLSVRIFIIKLIFCFYNFLLKIFNQNISPKIPQKYLTFLFKSKISESNSQKSKWLFQFV